MRTTGTKAGNYAIVGPLWKGELPAGVQKLTPSRTPSAFILARTLLRGPDDLPAVDVIALRDGAGALADGRGVGGDASAGADRASRAGN
jgi:hypothetical protein